jgi:DNA-binding response OmpR family regulator
MSTFGPKGKLPSLTPKRAQSLAPKVPGFSPDETIRRIVIIDDSELVLGQSRAVLVAAGYDVIATSQTVGASRHLATADLVIIDLHMPGFDGRDMVQSMRNSIRGSKRPCLMYLYTSDEEAAGDHRAMGFDGCFTEKGDPRALVEQVGAVFRLLQMRGIAGRIRSALDP